jgi:hypothetical protein
VIHIAKVDFSADSFRLNWELFRRRIAVLPAADPAVVILGRFVQLQVPVPGKGGAALALAFLRASSA